MAIIDFLFPKHCPVCLRPLLPDGRLICPECRKRIPYIRSPFCLVCGAPVTEEEEMTCKNCKSGRAFDRGVSWADYTDPAMRRMIARVKFHGEAQLLDFPSRDLAERKKELLLSLRPEALIPVPVSPVRLLSRGYNQAEEIAKRISEVLRLPVDTSCLLKQEGNGDQKTLSRVERKENLLKAFTATEAAARYRSVILVDDILTTGSTLDACALQLKRAGVKKVLVTSLLAVPDT